MYGAPGLHNRDSQVRFVDLNLLESRDAAIAVQRLYGGRDFKRSLEREFETNLDFWEGGVKQWKKWAITENKRVLDPAITDDELLISFNLILEIGETLVSRLIRHDPRIISKAVSTDRRDMQTARMLGMLMNYSYKNVLRFTEQLGAFLRLVFCSPVAWMTGGWHAQRGHITITTFEEYLDVRMTDAFPSGVETAQFEHVEMIFEQAREEFVDHFGKDSMQKGRVVQYDGEEFVDHIPVSEMCWYPWRPNSWDDVLYYVRTTKEEIPVVAEMYDMTAEEVRRRAFGYKQGSHGGPLLMDDVRANRMNAGIFSGHDEGEKILHHQFKVRASLKYPEGVQGAVLGNDFEAIRVGVLDNKNHEIPYFPLVHHPLPLEPWGTCLVSQLRSGQLDLNKAASQESLFRDQNIFPNILVPEEGIVDQDDWEFDNRPGRQRRYQGGPNNRPSILERPKVDLGYIRSIDRDVTFLREMSSVSAIQAGKTDDAHIRSGRAIERLDEKTNERLVEFAIRINNLMGRFWLFMATEYQTKPTGKRITQIVGEGYQLETLNWTRESLRPQSWDKPNQLAAIIEMDVASGAQAPMSAMQRQGYVLALVNGKILRPGEHDAEIWRLLGGDEAHKLEERDRKDRAQQNWEIDQWRKGREVPPPLRQEKHDIHINEIDEWMRSGHEYRELIQVFPRLFPQIEQHRRLHQVADMMNKIEPILLGERAKVQAWIAVQRGIGADVESGVASEELLQLISSPAPGVPPQLLPLEQVLTMAPLVPTEVEQAQGNQGVPAQQSQNVGQPLQQGADKPGMEEGRDRRRDLADQGVSRESMAI